MNPYHKIETLFDRDKETFRVIEGQYRRPEFALIDRWNVTEKIDGTNIRLTWLRDAFDLTVTNSFIGGRTDKAEIPKPLLAALTEIRENVTPEVEKIMAEHDLFEYTLYGEGYGPGIQGGGYYRNTPGFILFDVKAGGSWLAPQATWETAHRLRLSHVPVIGTMMKTEDITFLVRSGYQSVEAEVERRGAEGIIAKPRVPLYNARGERVIWKLKHRDYVGGKL